MDIVDRIFNLVDEKYKEQQDFAKDLNVTASIVSQWRRRKSSSFTKKVDQIASVLGTSVAYLWTGKEKEPTAPEGGELVNTITFSRNGEIVKKQYSPDKWKTIIEMLDAIPEDKLP